MPLSHRSKSLRRRITKKKQLRKTVKTVKTVTKKRQSGGSVDTLRNLGQGIEKAINNINNVSGELTGKTEELMKWLDEIQRTAAMEGKTTETEKEIRNYMEMLLKDEKNLKNIFPEGTKPGKEYTELLEVLAKFGKLRNDTDTLIKFVYRYINMRFNYPAGSVGGPMRNGPGWNKDGGNVKQSNLPFTTSSNDLILKGELSEGQEPMDDGPQLTRSYNTNEEPF
jgi:hypothetical protein